MDSKLWILLNPASNQVHKHSETALDTQKKKEFLKSFAYFLQVLYKCYTFVV